MKDKLILILSFTTVFSLGCATATVLVATASAEPPPAGQEQCAAFQIGGTVGKNNEDEGIAKHARTLPPGWRGVGGQLGTPSVVFACRSGG
jgi:hypothetical protein